jgi:hypothetical protein
MGLILEFRLYCVNLKLVLAREEPNGPKVQVVRGLIHPNPKLQINSVRKKLLVSSMKMQLRETKVARITAELNTARLSVWRL